MATTIEKKIRKIFKDNHIEDALFYLEQASYEIAKLRDPSLSADDEETIYDILRDIQHAQNLGWLMFKD